MNCLFCKIIAGEIPSKKIYESDEILAFYDIEPQAPFHALIIPKTHISSANEICCENSAIISKIFEVATVIANEQGLENGYRIVTNIGDDGCQSVKHLHFHLLGGKKLSGQMC